MVILVRIVLVFVFDLDFLACWDLWFYCLWFFICSLVVLLVVFDALWFVIGIWFCGIFELFMRWVALLFGYRFWLVKLLVCLFSAFVLGLVACFALNLFW